MWPFDIFRPKKRELSYEQALMLGLIDRPSKSGVVVSEATAMGISAVHCAVKVISEAVGLCTLHWYERTKASRRKATNHYLYPILHDEPNREMTTQVWLETSQAHALLWGNSYSELVRDGAARIQEIYPICPSRVQVKRTDGGELYYLIDNKNEIEPANMLHVPGLSPDGTQGYRLVQLAREALGYVMATERYGQSYWGNGARPGAVLSSPGELSENALRNLQQSWASNHGGPDNAMKTAVLEQGMTVSWAPGNNEQAQYQEIRQFNISEVSRLFNLNPILLHDMGRATWGNFAEVIGQFYQQTLAPWLKKWERELTRKCDRSGRFYAEFNIDSLWAGDPESRNKRFMEEYQYGVRNTNEWRESMNLEPVEGGETRYIMSNLVPLVPPEPPETPEEEATEPDTQEITSEPPAAPADQESNGKDM